MSADAYETNSPYDEDEDSYEDWLDEDEYFDCGAMRDMDHRLTGCQKAGSEECDFECPYRESVERSLRAQDGWAKRKARAGPGKTRE